MATIHTARLVLRPYEAYDWESFRSLVQDSEVMWRLSGPLSSESARGLLNRLIAHEPSTGLVGWAVLTKPDGNYCGHVFIHNYNRDERSAELGFILVKQFHGQRLGAELATAALEYARTELECESVSATVDEDNEPSKAVLVQIGMSVKSRRSDSNGSYLVYSDARMG